MDRGGGRAALEPPTECVVLMRRLLPRGGSQLLLVPGGDSDDRVWSAPTCRRRPGEAIYPCALRAVDERAGFTDVDVWALDLSGDTAVFGCDVEPADEDPHAPVSAEGAPRWVGFDDPGAGRWRGAEQRLTRVDELPVVAVAFRPMTRTDFPDVVRWVRAAHVARWWDDEATDVDRAERHYGPALDGLDPTRMWVVELNGRSVGFVQDYRIGDHPEWAVLTARPEAIGLDYAIGEVAWVGRGIGTRVLWTFLRDVVRRNYPDATTYFAAPDHRNSASLRVLDKLGFTQGWWFDELQRDGRVSTLVGCSLDVRRMFGDPIRG